MASKHTADAAVQDYLDYSKWLLVGWAAGLLVGWLLDAYFVFGNPALEGLSRFIVGYGDTIGATAGILIGRLRSKRKSQAETFWLGTLVGALVGPALHIAILWLGFGSVGIAGALIAVAYSNSDNWGGVIASFLKAKQGKGFSAALGELAKDKFVVANIIALLLMLVAAIAIRMVGIAPTSYFATAVEGAILDNDSTLAVGIFLLWHRFSSKSPAGH
jgi:hypothetical protein